MKAMLERVVVDRVDIVPTIAKMKAWRRPRRRSRFVNLKFDEGKIEKKSSEKNIQKSFEAMTSSIAKRGRDVGRRRGDRKI